MTSFHVDELYVYMFHRMIVVVMHVTYMYMYMYMDVSLEFTYSVRLCDMHI